MKKSTICLAMVFSLHAFAATECDEHLYHRITQATARLLHNQAMDVEGVRRMIESARPRSPFGEHAPHPRVQAAHHYYAENLPRLSQVEWERIRSELGAVLQRQDAIRAVGEEAERDTADVKGLFPQPSLPIFQEDIFDAKQTPDGRTYILYNNRMNDHVQLYDLSSPSRPKISRDNGGVRYAALTLESSGDPLLSHCERLTGAQASYGLVGRRIDGTYVNGPAIVTENSRVGYHAGFARGIQVIGMDNAEVYGVGESVVEFKDARGLSVIHRASDYEGFPLVVLKGRHFVRVARFNGHEWSFVDGGQMDLIGNDSFAVSVLGLRDGRVVVAWFDNLRNTREMNYRLGGGPTQTLFSKRGTVRASQILEMPDGQVFIATSAGNGTARFMIHQLGNPEFEFSRGITAMTKFKLFERHRKLYAVTVGGGTLDLFEPRLRQEPVFAAPLSFMRENFSLVEAPGNRILIIGSEDPSGSKVFSLFERTR